MNDKIINVTCRICQQCFEVKCMPEDYANWKGGKGFIQDLMPYLSADDRELLISRTCGACFDNEVSSVASVELSEYVETNHDVIMEQMSEEDEIDDADLDDGLDDFQDDEEYDDYLDDDEDDEDDDLIVDLSISELALLAEWCDAVSKFIEGDRSDSSFCQLGMKVFVASDDKSSEYFKILSDRLRLKGLD